jgi:hypothetical protein
MAKIEERLDRLEESLARFGANGERCAADMSPAERRARILELVSKELGLERVMTQAEYENWLIRTYPVAATEPPLPDSRGRDPTELDEITRRGMIEAYRARQAWDLVQRRRIEAERPPIISNGAGA